VHYEESLDEDVALWAIHCQGPDDILAALSKGQAEAEAALLNKQFPGDDDLPPVCAVAIPWEGTAKAFAIALARRATAGELDHWLDNVPAKAGGK
jgi:hypothetical protein